MNKIGIYKITSPTKRIYIGQSRNIDHRFAKYYAMNQSNSTQIRLWRSFKKYGVHKHLFEIIELCSIEELNTRERYWQDFYNVLSKDGLNCILQETNVLPRGYTKEYLLKVSGENHFFYGKKHPKEVKLKMSISAKKRKASQKTKEKLSIIRKDKGNPFYGKKHSKKSKDKMSESAKSRKVVPENETKRRKGISKRLSKPVFQYDLEGNFIKEYSSVTEAAKSLNSHVGSIVHAIQGKKVTKHKNFKWSYQ